MRKIKLFKRKIEFRFFGIRIVVMLSTYRYGYKRGEKVEVVANTEQTNMFNGGDMLPRCECGKLMGLITGGAIDTWHYKCECGKQLSIKEAF
jgi:hypothetical protein